MAVMKTRTLPASLTSALDLRPDETVKSACQLLKEVMAEIHGGEWLAHIDHKAGFILIRPRTRT
jgi:hypothetical protein